MDLLYICFVGLFDAQNLLCWCILQRSPENGHILNGDIRQAEMKPSTGTSEAIPLVVSYIKYMPADNSEE